MAPLSSSNIFRILVATDNHLGYAEKDPERGNDSFTTFKEILELAVEKNVDFILLGGDLFHDNKPSMQCQVKCMDLLKAYTFNDKCVEFEYVSDPAENFPHLKEPMVNFHNPNLNVGIPVFSIHGNHDDPVGLGHVSALDVLSTAGLVNYFGRSNNLKEVKISPLLLVKGNAKLALYGLSAIKDERLFRLFKEERVQMLRPREYPEDWYSVLVLHQNHTERPPSNYIPEEFLDSFLDLVIWGHEHECKILPRESKNQYFLMQPGSSVATSLCEAEAVKKQVALLEINDENCIKPTALPLKTIRPFVFKTVVLGEHVQRDPRASDQDHAAVVEEFLETTVKSMMAESREQLTGHPEQPKKPLIRLRVEYEDERDLVNVIRFGHRFDEDVANSEEILLFRKTRQTEKKSKEGIDKEAMDAVFMDDVSETKVEDLVRQYFQELSDDSSQHLQLMTERGLAHAVTKFVEKDDKDAVADIFNHQVEKTMVRLSALDNVDEDNFEWHLSELLAERRARHDNDARELEEAAAVLGSTDRRQAPLQKDEMAVSSASSDDESTSAPPPPAASRGRGRGRGSRGARAPRAPRGGRGRASSVVQPSLSWGSRSLNTSNSTSSTQSKRPLQISGMRKGAVFDDDSD